MSRLKYDASSTARTHPGRRNNPALRLVSLGVLSFVGAGLLLVGVMNYVLDAAPAALVLDRGAALWAMIAGGLLDAIASVLLVRHLRGAGNTAQQ